MLAFDDGTYLFPCSSLKLDYHVSLQPSASETNIAPCRFHTVVHTTGISILCIFFFMLTDFPDLKVLSTFA